MAAQGKTLQTVYDESVHTLDVLAQKQKGSMDSVREAASDAGDRHEEQVAESLKLTAEKFDQDIVAFVDGAIRHIKHIIELEKNENERLQAGLEAELKLLARSFEQEIKGLTEFISERLSRKNTTVMQQSDMVAGGAAAALDDLTFNQIKRLKALSQEKRHSFADHAVPKVDSICDMVGSVPAESDERWSRQAEATEARLQTAQEELWRLGEESKTKIEFQVAELEQGLAENIERLAAETGLKKQQAEDEAREQAKRILATLAKQQEEFNERTFNDLQNELRANQEDLFAKLNEVHRDTAELSSQLRGNITSLSASLRKNGEDKFKSYMLDVAQKVAAARSHEQTIDEEWRHLIAQLKAEIDTIELSFESHLQTIAHEYSEKLFAACAEGEAAIVRSHDLCSQEYKELIENQKRNMEAKTASLLARINSLTEKAVAGIRSASQEESSGRGSRKRSKTSDSNGESSI
ncbi:MAG: hypothetical protein K2W82_10365 [Candidatus Obscuribacterales bacterium]|nr:hypothetical protein [Candidatus Obscuribacterales bacterium]